MTKLSRRFTLPRQEESLIELFLSIEAEAGQGLSQKIRMGVRMGGLVEVAEKRDSFYSFQVKAPGGKVYPLSKHLGQVALVVNVASQCGYTPQYKGLEELYRELQGQGFVVLGFPCNQFGLQEPGTEAEIQNFCELNYQVTFPILAKVEVNGTKTDPAYQFLKGEAPGILGTQAIKWNFTKFLVGKQGQVLKRYAPTTEPSEILKDIQEAIARA